MTTTDTITERDKVTTIVIGKQCQDYDPDALYVQIYTDTTERDIAVILDAYAETIWPNPIRLRDYDTGVMPGWIANIMDARIWHDYIQAYLTYGDSWRGYIANDIEYAAMLPEDIDITALVEDYKRDYVGQYYSAEDFAESRACEEDIDLSAYGDYLLNNEYWAVCVDGETIHAYRR
jgi:hypothetical protein